MSRKPDRPLSNVTEKEKAIKYKGSFIHLACNITVDGKCIEQTGENSFNQLDQNLNK